ncbi:MAG TPA: DUF2304 domain-containing protein [Candidatus Omnitrophota bacterium]|nr:DUF2304 domain-containing protein [Candidatus Omnitrophota bacterium]
MQPKTFALCLTAFILIAVIDLIRRQKMSFKYALTWLVLSAGVIFFTIYDAWLRNIAQWAGFALPSNFIFFLLLIFVIFSSLLLTLYINEQNNRTETIAQAIAKLDLRIKQIEEEKKKTTH